MNSACKPFDPRLTWVAVAAVLVGFLVVVVNAAAQDAPAAPVPPAPKAAAKSSAQQDAGEPRADTSSPSPRGDTAATPATPAAVTPAAVTPAATPTPAAPAAAASHGTARSTKAPAGGKAGNAKAAGTTDRLDLNTATVTGDREQPKVMYIVPWKKSDIGDLSGKPMNSLLDEALAPVDRDEFKREVAYYDAIKAAPQNGASKPLAQGEK